MSQDHVFLKGRGYVPHCMIMCLANHTSGYHGHCFPWVDMVSLHCVYP